MRAQLTVVADRLGRAIERRLGAGNRSDRELLETLLATLQLDYGEAGDAESDVVDEQRIRGLADVFSLSSVDVSLLAIGAAADLDANLGIAFGALGPGSGPSRPTVALALELVGVPTASAEAFELLGPEAPLRQTRLLDVEGSGPFLSRGLHVADRVSAYLVGHDAPDSTVAGMRVPSVAFHCEASDQLARVLARGAGLGWVRGPLGTAARGLAVAAFASLGLEALVVDARRASGPPGLFEALATAAREAALTGRGLVVVGMDVVTGHGGTDATRDDAGDAAALLRMLRRAPAPVVAVAPTGVDPTWLDAPVLTVDARALTPAERADVWTEYLAGVEGVGWDELLGLRLQPEEIAHAVAQAELLASARNESVTIPVVREAAREIAAGSGTKGQTAARRSGVRAGLDDLILPGRVIADVQRLVRWAVYRDQVLSRGAVQGKGGKGSGIAALFTGNPGTGKTLAANVIADELGLELMQVDLSSVVDKYIGETEKNLERIFHEAESRNVILFFDEADALFGSRSEVRDARDRYANQEVSYLLQRMEHYDGITVLATNLRGNLDQAFSRRMQFIVHFPDPDLETRARLWTQHLEEVGDTDAADPIDLALLARVVELAGGDIRNIVLAATYDAVSSGELVGMRHVRAATAREYGKLGRRIPDGLTTAADASELTA